MKTALITGVAGGMGFATAQRLAASGYIVYGLDVRPPASGADIRFLPADLTDASAVERAFHTLREQNVTLDCFIHMAGLYDLHSLVEMDEERFLRIFNVNLFSVYRVNKIFLPLLAPGGTVIITSSELAPLDPLPFTGLYGITKAALEKYAFSLRMELQLLGRRVVVIRPGAVDTGLLTVSTDRLQEFCAATSLYNCNADRFHTIVNRVEAHKIPPEKVAALVQRVLRARQPRHIYAVNRNPLLLLLHALPDGWQCKIIKKILTP